ncbi:TPX2 (targeting protein for Xklp2) protein family [Artemisia annua]|uniref:TPX2 (Targeting protein for Xklp2) protein family n=1 Tax=Artemisia annua TaxID=35608 RepID=A0A2U1LWQ9_ARTAN|nr:TPX2 (targeting protein for Xklp2) protein family [Artemisia annua]
METLTPSKPKLNQNSNPNLATTKPSKSKSLRSAVKKPVSPSPKTKIRDRKFVVAKKSKGEKAEDGKCKCKCRGDNKKCVCVAYESLRASQDEFTKTENVNVTEKDELVVEIGENLGESEKMSEKVKRRREKVLEVARGSIPETGIGRVMHLVKAFENALTLPKEETGSEEKEEKVMAGSWELPGLRPRAPVTEFSSPELLLTRESLGLDPCGSGSSGSISRRDSGGGGGGRHSRRNSAESSATVGGSRGKRRTHKATPQQPFKLKTEQRGRSKQEEFIKKVQEMLVEQEKQRIRVAQGLPWTTDEPECLAKPPVKDCTRPVDLVLHSDMRAMERAEFDHQVLEKLSLAEQYKLERERQQKLEEEEELRRLRKELVPKAQPMPYFDRPFVPKRSEKQPTMPKEPKFHNPQNKKMPAGQ